MIEHLFDRYCATVQRFVLVVHPSFEADVKRHVEQIAPSLNVQFATQAEPTGMLDAILLAANAARTDTAGRVWITWCDQIGVHPHTVTTLDQLSHEHPGTPAILPTSRQVSPYIHLARDADGRITGILQRREGDDMPLVGESDVGLFSLSSEAYSDLLPRFARETTQSTTTRERNFLPFLPWLVERGYIVLTFPSASELEAIGINTPDDRVRLEAYLRDLDKQ